MKNTFYLLLISLISGCAAGYEGIVLHEEGVKPTVDQAREFVLKDLQRTLRDPESLKSFSVISGPDVITGITAGRAQEKAWAICVEYNAKNAYGGYTGINSHQYILRFSGKELVKISRINWIAQDRSC